MSDPTRLQGLSAVQPAELGEDEGRDLGVPRRTLVWLPRTVPHAFANLADEPAWLFGTTTPAGLEGMFKEQAEYFESLTGPPDESEIDAIGAKWGVTRVGPPLRLGDEQRDPT